MLVKVVVVVGVNRDDGGGFTYVNRIGGSPCVNDYCNMLT